MKQTISGNLQVVSTAQELNAFVAYELCVAAAALFFNGICLLLFAFAAFYLQKTKTWTSRVFLALAAILMLCALAQVCLDVACAATFSHATQILEGGGSPQAAVPAYQAYLRMYLAREALTSINNAITDGLLLYRCVTIWGPSPYARVVTGVPLLLILGTVALGMWGTFAVENSTPIPFAMALLTNFVLFSLTAGKIWRKGRQTTVVLGAEAGKRYNTTLEIICESSLLYFLTVLVYLISSVVGPFSLLTSITWGALAQVVNIVPMMIMILRRQSKQQVRDGPDFRRHHTLEFEWTIF
ncbi:hypothetical protein B0H12DRAFT_161756 [Mycena haematopus]|nr:hypothetical protein B0H12DRAFT_161756 [Mycena haematopus]